MISPENEVVLRRLLVGAGMADIVPESEFPRDKGKRKLLAGLFAVEHKPTSERLIIDRRPQNATERRLNWCKLPHGTLLTRLRLAPDEHVRASADDISCFFYFFLYF